MSQENKPHSQPPATSTDAGSQALAEALRSSFTIVKLVMVVLVAVFLFSGFFTVGPQEKAIILRLGRPIGGADKSLLGAGPHWAWPYPIDEVVKVPITESQIIKSSIGWYYVTPEQEASGIEPPPMTAALIPLADGYVLTADGNIVHTRAILRYRIDDPIRCVFGFTRGTNGTFSLDGVANTVQNALDNALVSSAARFTVDEILRDVTRFKEAVQQRVRDLAQSEQLGIVIEQCDVESRAPRQLKDSFEKVTTASQNHSKLVNEARSYAVQVVSQAGADATSLTNLAETISTNLIKSVNADAVNFAKLLPTYEANRDLFVQQRLIATLSRVLTNAQDKIYLPTTPDGKPIELRLLLNREQPKAKTQGGTQ